MPDMTLDEIRERIALLKGYKRCDRYDGWWIVGKCPDGDDMIQRGHPVPPSLDWVAANWPKDRPLFVQFTLVNEGEPRTWSASSFSDREADYPTELHARMALLLAVLDAEGKT